MAFSPSTKVLRYFGAICSDVKQHQKSQYWAMSVMIKAVHRRLAEFPDIML